MTEQPVLYELRDNVAVLTLNRPHRLNAINLEMLTQLIGWLDDARQDPAVSCAILTGAGRAFCSGEDLKETAAGKTLEAWEQEVAGLQEVQRAVMRLGKPLIAAVRGYAVGGGCEFAMSCDIRVASEDARFGFPETAVGMTVTTAGTKLLSHLVGLGRAKELVLTGEFIDADEAARIGLVNRVVPGDSLVDEAMEMAARIAEHSPLALRLSRTAIEQGLYSTFEQTLDLEASQIMECIQEGSYFEYAKRTAGRMGRGRG